ncbi:hypothetical protein P3T73_11900 [Kiritimatiellota bacterium B12222]|nr:hypothetical protein P3T73_11900 [Kiritimatiellota bacterium B12222]
MADRSRDLTDIFTVAGETGLVNANLQLGKANLGVGAQSGHGMGLRSGAIGMYETGDLNLLLVSAKYFEPNDEAYYRGKGYEYTVTWQKNKKDDGDRLDLEMDEGGNFNLFQIEFSASLGLGIRLGINFAEMADFFVGIFNFDPLKDDRKAVAERKAKFHQQKEQVEQLQNAANKNENYLKPAVDN